MRTNYLSGVLAAEERLRLLNGDVGKAYGWLNNEAQRLASDYRWSDWLNGAHDFLVYHLKSKVRV